MDINSVKQMKYERTDQFVEELRLNPNELSSYLKYIEYIRSKATKREKYDRSD